MKAILLLLLVSAPALACKPVPLASCENEKSILLKGEQMKQLQNKVAEFQKLLDELVLNKAGGDSCFNNHFSGFYLSGLKEPFTCRKQVTQVENAINALLNPESAEWKMLKREEDKPKLETLGSETKSILKYFLKEHAD